MPECISCHKRTEKRKDHFFHVLQVRTLPVRDLDRAKRVQALGEFADYAVCAGCAAARLKRDRSIVKAAAKRLTGFALVLALGILLLVLTFTVLHRERVYLTLAVSAIACGVLGTAGAVLDAGRRRAELSGMGEAEALRESAWSVLTDRAPKKDKDIDLTYIPVDAKSMDRKNGDLMILYDLLPRIAVQAYERIHQEYHALKQKSEA